MRFLDAGGVRRPSLCPNFENRGGHEKTYERQTCQIESKWSSRDENIQNAFSRCDGETARPPRRRPWRRTKGFHVAIKKDPREQTNPTMHKEAVNTKENEVEYFSGGPKPKRNAQYPTPKVRVYEQSDGTISFLE